MSKDFLLNYAKGDKTEPNFIIVFSAEPAGMVKIHSCAIIAGQSNSVLIRKTYDTGWDVPEKAVIGAAKRYITACMQ